MRDIVEIWLDKPVADSTYHRFEDVTDVRVVEEVLFVASPLERSTFPLHNVLGVFKSGEEYVRGMAAMIKDGTVWHLQGSYQRAAMDLIDNGVVSPEGEILMEGNEDE